MPIDLSEHQSRRLQQAALTPIAVGLTVLVLLACRLASIELPLFGPGPRTWVGAGIVAFVYFVWIKDRFAALPDTPERPLCEAALSLIVLPLGLLGGRILFCILGENLAAACGLILGAFALRFLTATENFDRFTYHRGTKLFTAEAFAAVARMVRADAGVVERRESAGHAADVDVPVRPATATVEWAGDHLPLNTIGHSLAIGAPGSGKTLMHRAAVRSIVSWLRPEHDFRMVLYDVKLDLLSELYAMRPAVPVYVMNPLDARGAAWNIAADFNNPNHAMDLAKCFAPDKSEATGDRDNLFFRTAAQMVLAGTIEACIRGAPGQWTLRDLVNLTSDKDTLKKVLLGIDQTAAIVNNRFAPKRTFNDVLQTLNNSTQALKVVAAAYEANSMKVSLREIFAHGSAIIVLGTNMNFRASAEAVNRAMFRFMTFEALGGPESVTQPRLSFHCDELAEARYLSGLSALMSDGRSKGITAFLGTQNIEGMRDAFGGDEAMTILNQCGNVSVLRQASPETAEWASKRIGEVERFEYMRGDLTEGRRHERRPDQRLSEALVSRPAVMPSELLGLPVVRGGVVSGVHVLASLGGAMRTSLRYPLHQRTAAVDYQPRPDLARLELAPWNDADERRLVRTGDGVADRVAPATPAEGRATAAPSPLRSRTTSDWLRELEQMDFD